VSNSQTTLASAENTHGKACEFDTCGLLQRAHIIANWPPIHIGKESDKHWEEGEDLSLLEFKTVEYKRKGNAVATKEQLERIAKIPKREFIRRGINQHTLEKICRKEPVRAIKLAICLKVLEGFGAKSSLPASSPSEVSDTPTPHKKRPLCMSAERATK
jgi:hypothetical protein